jgi:hypothetical protein
MTNARAGADAWTWVMRRYLRRFWNRALAAFLAAAERDHDKD